MKVLFEKAKAKNARVQMSEAFITSVFLALSGGFQDAYTYFTRDEVFSNAQTGNVVLMSQHFMLGEWQRGLHYLIPLLAFAGGVFFADCVQGKFKYANRLHWRQGILLLEILILFGVGFIPQDYNMLATTLVSFSCAMQVQSFRKVGGYSYASTMCIGNLRSGTAALSAYMRDRRPEQIRQAMENVDSADFTVLLAHRPELLAKYAQFPVDLVVSGHAHGGQVRIPGVLNGLYAPNQGWFPKLAGGAYAQGGTTLIVSRGLAVRTRLPRIFNRPEVVLVRCVSAE